MPDEIEVPLEDTQEHIAELHKERFHKHSEGKEENEENAKDAADRWTRYVALSTAVLAVVAALGALQSGLLVNEALLAKNEQVGKLTLASDQWNYYQAEGLKSLIYQTTAQALPASSPNASRDLAQAKHYEVKQTEIKSEAERLVTESKSESVKAEHFLSRHHIFAFSVSLCQIAIALSAVAALTKRKPVWYFGLGSGVLGTLLIIYGFLH